MRGLAPRFCRTHLVPHATKLTPQTQSKQQPYIASQPRSHARHGVPPRAGEITRIALQRGLVQRSGKTPEATMASALYTDVKRKEGRSAFWRPAEGLFGLRSWAEAGMAFRVRPGLLCLPRTVPAQRSYGDVQTVGMSGLRLTDSAVGL